MYVPTGKLFSDNVDMSMAVISGIALAVVAACDEDENNSIHSGRISVCHVLRVDVWFGNFPDFTHTTDTVVVEAKLFSL